MKYTLKTYSGFTLIELLVVISIIGLLSSVVLTSLASARNSGKDASRIESFIQLRNALELYRASNNGKYPITYDAWSHTPGGDEYYFGVYGDNIATDVPSLFSGGVIPTYMKVFQFNPADQNIYTLIYWSDGNDYMLEGYDYLANPLSTKSSFTLKASDGSPIMDQYSIILYTNQTQAWNWYW